PIVSMGSVCRRTRWPLYSSFIGGSSKIAEQSVYCCLAAAFAFEHMCGDVVAIGAPRQNCRRSLVEQSPTPSVQPSIHAAHRGSRFPRFVCRHRLGVVVARDRDVPSIWAAHHKMPMGRRACRPLPLLPGKVMVAIEDAALAVDGIVTACRLLGD